MRPFEFPTAVSVSPSLSHPLAPAPLSYLYLSIFRSRSRFSLFSLRLVLSRLYLFVPPPPPPPSSQPTTLSRSHAHLAFLYLSFCLSCPLFVFLSPHLSHAPLSRRLARASIEPAEHQPILHLNLVNLPELANELRAWCLILAHEHGRRYTASNASGEGTRVQSFAKVVGDRRMQSSRMISS